MGFELREWQRAALERCNGLQRSIVEACPGAGKSAFSGGLAKQWLDSGDCTHVLAVVPSVSIQRGVMRAWKNTWGLRVRSRLVKRTGNAFRVPLNFDATVITYHELRNEQSVDALKMWRETGWKFGVVFDEIHHAASSQVWGDRVKTIGHDLASRVCIMTGTPFRSDGQPIELMEYVVRDGESVADPDYRYVYRQAVQDDVCRPVTCRFVKAEVVLSHVERGVYSKDIRTLTDYERAKALDRVFDPQGEPMGQMIRLVHDDLMRLRANERYQDASALFVCRPGKAKEANSDKHVREMAKRIEQITGQEVMVVTHDDKDSADRIDAFNRSNAPYIAAVNMIQEGVDIPRLRKVAFCRMTESEMLFRQIVGRVIRKTIDNDPIPSTIYVPEFATLIEFAERIWDEAEAGLKEKKDCGGPCFRCGQKPCICEGPELETRKLLSIDAHGEAGSGVFDQVSVETPWIALAEQVTNTHTIWRHYDHVALGAFLKTANAFNPTNAGIANESQVKANLCDRLRRRMTVLARVGFDGDYGRAWREGLFDKYEVASLEDIRTLWTHDRIEAAIRDIERSIDHHAHAHKREASYE